MPSIQNWYQQCAFCKRHILVQIVLCGINHNTHVAATCGECFKIHGLSKDYIKHNRKDAKKIKKWLKEI